VIVAFRKHTLLPLDDCLYALQATIPHLTRSSLRAYGEHEALARPMQHLQIELGFALERDEAHGGPRWAPAIASASWSAF